MLKIASKHLESVRSRMFDNNNGCVNQPSQISAYPVILFFITIIFYIVYQLAMQPGWILGGEMWAEMATNYYTNANAPSVVQKLFSTDAGYIPLPQRLIAFSGYLFHLPASSIPYLYTWFATFLTGAMVGVFCLSQFKILVKSDALRFFVAIVVLIVSDFETKTFINFTYYSAFFIAVITALALVNDSDDVPIWAWFIPLLIISKPAVLAVLPAMIFVSMVSRTRFRWIVIVSVVLCVGQAIQLLVSQNAGTFAQAHEAGLIEKLITAFMYFFGFLGGYILGPNLHYNVNVSILFGILLFVVSVFVVFKKRKNSGALIVIGISLLLFNILLNSFALSDVWNGKLSPLERLPVYRHIIVGYFGCVLIVTGLLASMEHANQSTKRHILHFSSATVFMFWFVFTGWFSYGAIISREPNSPILNSSQWQAMSKVIDSDEPSFCVPIDPFSWQGGIYGRNCSLLNPSMDMGQEYVHVNELSSSYSLKFKPPEWVTPHYIMSIGILVKPAIPITTLITAKAKFTAKGNVQHEMFGERELSTAGGLLLLSGISGTVIRGVNSVQIDFNVPVDVKYIIDNSKRTPAILWMGVKATKATELYEGKIIHQPANNRGKEDGLFVVRYGLRRWIPDSAWIGRNGFTPADIIQIESSEFYSIPEDPKPIDN